MSLKQTAAADLTAAAHLWGERPDIGVVHL